MDVDDYILAQLSDGSKSFTELANAIVPKICARGTLSKHLKDLEEDAKIKRKLFEDRTTKYSLMPESINHSKSAKDVISFESLVNELEYKTRKELILEKVQLDEERKRIDLFRWLEPTKNRPKMNFRLLLDGDTLKLVNLIEPTSKFASNMEMLVRERLNEIKHNIPATIQNEFEEFIGAPKGWNEIKELSHKIALKYGLRFLVVSWYDGKEYKQKIMSAIKKLKKLERNEEDIYFLDEVNKRCFYSSLEYYYDPYLILEDILAGRKIGSILKISDPYQLLENAFWLYFWDKQELMWLEVGLISGSASTKLSKDVLKEKLPHGIAEIHSPYNIISSEAYLKMKLPFLGEGEKRFIIKDALEGFSEYLKSCGELFSSDYRSYPEDYHLAIDLLLDKLNIDKNKAQKNIQSPILNFQFYYKQNKIDFSDESLVINFFEFIRDPKKKKWLQKCLILGLPIFSFIPFKKLGVEVRNIL